MTERQNHTNKNLKRLIAIGSISLTLLVALLLVAFWFLFFKPNKPYDTMSYDGNHYYNTAYIQPNLQFEGEKTTIFGETNYLGNYTSKAFDNQKNSKLWTINNIPQKKLIVEMTPGKSSASYTTWTNKHLLSPKDAFDYLNPKYLTYAIDNSQDNSTKTLGTKTQEEVIKEVKKIIGRKPNLKTFQTITATSTYEIYFNNDNKQSLVLQVSLVETKKGTKLMSVAGDLGSINYWKVSDRLLNLLN